MRPFIQGQMYLKNLNYFLIIPKYKIKDRTEKDSDKRSLWVCGKLFFFSFSKVLVIAQQNCPLNTLGYEQNAAEKASSKPFYSSHLKACTCDVWKTDHSLKHES